MTKSTQYALGVFGLIIVLFFVNQKTQSNLNVSTSEIFEGDSSKIFRFQIINKRDTLDLIRNDSTWTIAQADTLIIKKNQVLRLAQAQFYLNREETLFLLLKGPKETCFQ